MALVYHSCIETGV